MKNTILAIVPYLQEEDEKVVQDMLDQEATENEILYFLNQTLDTSKKREILDRIDIDTTDIEDIFRFYYYLEPNRHSPAVRDELEYIDYIDKLDPQDQEYVKQFYYEYYGKGGYNIPEEERILTIGEMIKEANRVNNSLDRDAFSRSKSRKRLDYLEDQYEPNVVDDDRDLDWEDIFTASGYEAALKKIMDDSIDDLINSTLEYDVILVRFYVKMDRLRKMNNRDQVTRRKVNREKS